MRLLRTIIKGGIIVVTTTLILYFEGNYDYFLCFVLSGSVFGSKDYFYGLGIFFDTYSNHNGEHQVHVPYYKGLFERNRKWLSEPFPLCLICRCERGKAVL